MNKAETGQLLLAVSAIDNRKITQQMVDGWTEILRYIPLDVALEAHRIARKNDAIGYLEPKHIITFAKEAAFALDRQKPKEEPKPYVVVPQPTCREHQKKILSCDPCCRAMSQQSHLSDAQLLLWAKQNIYA